MSVSTLGGISAAILGQKQPGKGAPVGASSGADNGGGFGSFLGGQTGQRKLPPPLPSPGAAPAAEGDQPVLSALFASLDAHAAEFAPPPPRKALDLTV